MHSAHPMRAAALAVAIACILPVQAHAQVALRWYDYVDPPTVSSRNHLLSTTLTAAPARVALEGATFTANLYQGSLMPPVLKLEPGDTLMVRLANAIDTMLYDSAGRGGQTNLHFHGFAVSPKAPADDVLHVHVPVGGAYQYRIELPRDHAQGLFWYHPHSHPGSYDQVKAGLSGPISIGDPRRRFPQFAGAREIYLMLKFFQPDGDTEVVVVNGLPRVELPRMRVGQAQFWRIANIAAERYFRLRVVDPAGDSVPFQVLARDGNVVAFGDPVMIDQALLGAGQRAEIIVRGRRPGYYTLVATDFVRQVHEPDTRNPLLVDGAAVLARVLVEPALPGEAAVAAARGGDPDEARVIQALVAARPDSMIRDSIEFQIDRNGPDVLYPIDSVTYDPGVVTRRFVMGQTYVWRIKNSSQSWHTFHLHQTDFLVDSIGGQAMPRDYRLDTVSVPPCRAYGTDATCLRGQEGVSVIRFTYERPETVGEFVFHCHMLFHQDNGMMANVMLGPAPPAAAGGGTAHRH
ncbi:MAG TPA: multicopper oxidase family protein [Longimicrobium sp.]|nr:multicopper oxidase family protein [Longimicrobium sp.]